jgi:tyrosyl-tRNA synthetase
MTDFLAELRWRDQLHQASDEVALRTHLGEPRRAYVGYDPTSDSLTIGNLVTIMLLRRWQEAGHTPVVVMGGGTGLIGDPSGKSAERQLLTEDRVRANVDSQRRIFGSLLDFSGPRAATVVNNADWLRPLGYIEVLRDVGKHFSVNQMVARDSVRTRLESREQGISYTEFSYMILQAYDFLHLHRAMGVTVQMGGSDQWGNIVSGCDLIRRAAAETGAGTHAASAGTPGTPGTPSAFAVTAPLLTKADGGKFGKTESGAVWLTRERTSAYAYYQFWLNAADADVEKFLKCFTMLGRDEIASITERHAANPGAREAQRVLADRATELLHGLTELDRAKAATAALFSGELASLSRETLDEVLAAAPATTHDRALLAGEGVPLADVLALTSLAGSRTQARQFLAEGSVAVNGAKATAADRLTLANLLHGTVIALRRGKKNWHVTRWE